MSTLPTARSHPSNPSHPSAPSHSHPTRRAVVAGAAWAVPLVAVGAPAAMAGVSKCQVTGSIQVGPNVPTTIRAICTSQSQWLHPGTIKADYASGSLPAYLEICNCQNADSWYRWQETDTVDNFQIEVDGVHVDQNSSAAGWRASFFLPGFGEAGGCKKFALSYRTSVARAVTPPTPVSITFRLQSGPTSTGPWTLVTTITVSGTFQRINTPANAAVNFTSCSGGGTPNFASSGGSGSARTATASSDPLD